jgi:Mg-chelatase subunit ChlD
MGQRRPILACLLALLFLPFGLEAQRHSPGPIRIVLLVDSSQAMAAMLPQFRAGMHSFLNALPGEPEIAFVSAGGQLRVRVPPTSDRAALHQAVDRFTSDGGANSFLETMYEADKRFLRNAPGKRSVFVVLTTDNGGTRVEPRVDEYNRFMKQFVERGGRAHGIVVAGVHASVTSTVLMNLTNNTNGFFDTLTLPNPLVERMKALADFVALDMS